MEPSQLSEALRLLATYAEQDPSPSRIKVASDLRAMIAVTASGDRQHQAAVFDGVKTWFKRWRALKTTAAKKLQGKLKELVEHEKIVPKLIQATRNGDPITPLLKDKAAEHIFYGFTHNQFSVPEGGSAYLDEFCAPEKVEDVLKSAERLEKFWGKSDYKEERRDRSILVHALSRHAKIIAKQIQDIKENLDEQVKMSMRGSELDTGEPEQDADGQIADQGDDVDMADLDQDPQLDPSDMKTDPPPVRKPRRDDPDTLEADGSQQFEPGTPPEPEPEPEPEPAPKPRPGPKKRPEAKKSAPAKKNEEDEWEDMIAKL